MAENDLAERVRQYGKFLDEYMGKIQIRIRQQSFDDGFREGDVIRRLNELYGQETAYRSAIREFREKFPKLCSAKPKTE